MINISPQGLLARNPSTQNTSERFNYFFNNDIDVRRCGAKKLQPL